MTSFLSRQLIMIINSTSMALAGVEPLLFELRRSSQVFANGAGVFSLLVLAFEIRYTFFRGKTLVKFID